eukprot:TRINITY_DN122487_c0_g1_i1.p1 TRINITY_DN122487_c0_g1~~TRINITY_DN122487_c0_g1_i1.p1  ORF type:complete len:541 (-),score=70.64 TRINITY_DN122487_c0_g1_i1:7-1629(-)
MSDMFRPLRRWLVRWLTLASCAAGLYDPVRKIESARLYGNIDMYAYYFVDILVGSPPQRVSVILDTGSGLAAFPCAGCPQCGSHIDPLFDFSRSSTAAWVPCDRSICRDTCKQDHCSYYQGYQESSSIEGDWFEDYVRLGDAIQRNPPVKARLGCHRRETKLFYTQKANGIFGVQGTRSVLNNLFADSRHVDSRVFSICLAEWGGRLTVGGYNNSYHRGQIQYVPFLGNRYSVELLTMKIEAKTVSNFRTTVIDSGTTYTYMGSEPYWGLRNEIEHHCGVFTHCMAERDDKCWNLQDSEALDRFPVITVEFASGVSVRWGPRAYLYNKGTTNTWCYAFENDGKNANTVLGASWMLHKEIVFDLKSNRAGIVDANCPEYKERPTHTVDAELMKPPGPSSSLASSGRSIPPPGGDAARKKRKPLPKRGVLNLNVAKPRTLLLVVISISVLLGTVCLCCVAYSQRGRQDKAMPGVGRPMPLPEVVAEERPTAEVVGSTFQIGGEDDFDDDDDFELVDGAAVAGRSKAERARTIEEEGEQLLDT